MAEQPEEMGKLHELQGESITYTPDGRERACAVRTTAVARARDRHRETTSASAAASATLPRWTWGVGSACGALLLGLAMTLGTLHRGSTDSTTRIGLTWHG